MGSLAPSPLPSLPSEKGREEDGSSQDGVGRGEVGSWAASHTLTFSFPSLRKGREEDGSSQDGVGRGEVGSWATSHLVPRLLLVARLADVLAGADDDAFIPKFISPAAELVGDRKADLLVLQVRLMRLPGPEKGHSGE